MSDEPRSIVQVDGIVKDFRPGFGLRRKRVLHGISLRVREGDHGKDTLGIVAAIAHQHRAPAFIMRRLVIGRRIGVLEHLDRVEVEVKAKGIGFPTR